MTTMDWPLRLIPRRSPALWQAMLITGLAMALGVGLRAATLGPQAAFGLSATSFPVFIVATLYAGSAWGWASLGTAIALGLLSPSVMPQGVSGKAIYAMFAISGALTVAVSSALREALVRLDEAHRRQTAIQAALDDSEQRLRMAQEAGGVGLWDWDAITGEGRWSQGLRRNLGLSDSAEANARRFLDLVHPEDREVLRQTNIRALKTGRMDPCEYRVIWADGSIHWLLSRGEVQPDARGRLVRALGVNIDVSDRRLAYEQVHESEARFRTLADSAPVLLWVSRIDGLREFVNKAYVDYLGVTYDEAVAFDWRTRLHPDDLDRILQEQGKGEASRAQFAMEARYRHRDGEWRWIRSISQPRHGPVGDFIGFIGIGVDVTEGKQAENNLKRINELLAERVDAALAERDQAEAALHRAQKLEAVGQLTGGVAHDFNNLLTVIIGALDLMQRHPDDGARRDRMIEAAMGAAHRGERLTQQLLAFSRRQALKPELVRVDDLLRESEALLHRAVGEAVELTIAPAAPDATAMIDPSQFEAAVMNLVVNARDAVAHGGAIRVETLACRLAADQVEEIEPGPYLAVVVHDTGIGMDDITMARVFEPFFTTKEVGKGTGLGLSQVYGFARQSGGGVVIDSAPGKGATVRMYLPRGAAQAQVDPAGPPAGAGAPVRKAPMLNVLLVEDDAPVGDLVAAMLEDLGHRVMRAENADDALPVLRAETRVDLLLTDVVMPGGRTGVDLAREAVGLRPALPVILSSGYSGDALGPADDAPWPLLRKPYSAQALDQMIARVLELARQAA